MLPYRSPAIAVDVVTEIFTEEMIYGLRSSRVKVGDNFNVLSRRDLSSRNDDLLT